MPLAESHREVNGAAVSFLCQTVNVRPAWIRIPKYTCDFIKSFPCSIVSCLSEKFKVIVISDYDKHSMTAGNNQR